MTKIELDELTTYADSVLEQSFEARKAFDFCKVFHYALPILKPIANFYFLPKRIKKILNDLIFVGEAVCPSPETALQKVTNVEGQHQAAVAAAGAGAETGTKETV